MTGSLSGGGPMEVLAAVRRLLIVGLCGKGDLCGGDGRMRVKPPGAEISKGTVPNRNVAGSSHIISLLISAVLCIVVTVEGVRGQCVNAMLLVCAYSQPPLPVYILLSDTECKLTR